MLKKLEKICQHKENKIKNINEKITTGFNYIPKILKNIYNSDKKERIDELMNLISEKYQEEGYFYIPQLCTLLKEKNYTESLEHFLLEQCGNKMKFSLYVYWILSSYRQQDDKKLKNFLLTMEMTLVNGLKKKLNSKKNEIKTDKEIYEENVSKEFRSIYYNKCITFYQNIKNFCENLKNLTIKARKNTLNIFLNYQNKEILNLIKREYIKETSKITKGLFRGYILPFNDTESIADEDCHLIVKFDASFSQCISTKARVPCKITFEVVKVKDLINFEEYFLDEVYLKEGRKYSISNNNDINNINEISLDEKKIEKRISLDEFLYNEMGSNEEEEKVEEIRNVKELKKKNKNLGLIKISNENRSLSTGEPPYYFTNYNLINLENKYGNPFGEKWLEISQKIKNTSPFRNFPSYTIKSFIAKSDDDLRQESLAMQLIKMISEIFTKGKLNLYLRTYEIIITSRNSGLIEFITDSISIDSLKRKTGTDLNTFYRNFFFHHFKEAQKNFVESLAAYSLVTYILDIKDRHNGNIMIDIQGRIIHIDFGFILGISPGNVGFETAPFKMTKEYVNLLDGINSEIFNYFIELLTKGFLEIRKYFDSFVKIVEIMGNNSDMPCFLGRDINLILRDLIMRFHLDKNETEIKELMISLTNDSIKSWRTYQYDMYQKLTNGIKA